MVHVLLLQLSLTVDTFDADWELLLKRSNDFASALLDQLFTLLDNMRRHYVVKVLGGNLNLNSFDPVTSDYSDTVLLYNFVADAALFWIF